MDGQQIIMIADSDDDMSDGFCSNGLRLIINRAPKVLSRPRFHRGGIGNKESKEKDKLWQLEKN